MNQLGKDKLRAAWLAGTPQWFAGVPHRTSADCAMLLLSRGIEHSFSLLQLDLVFGLSMSPQICQICGSGQLNEWDLGVHYNDVHQLDFAKIADLMPLTEKELFPERGDVA